MRGVPATEEAVQAANEAHNNEVRQLIFAVQEAGHHAVLARKAYVRARRLAGSRIDVGHPPMHPFPDGPDEPLDTAIYEIARFIFHKGMTGGSLATLLEKMVREGEITLIDPDPQGEA